MKLTYPRQKTDIYQFFAGDKSPLGTQNTIIFTAINRLNVMVTHSTSLTTAPQLPVLLVFIPVVSTQTSELEQVLEIVRSIIDPTIRIMHVNEATYPEVVHSFNFSSLPAFALLQQGKELWQHSGLISSPYVIRQLNKQIQEVLLCNVNSK